MFTYAFILATRAASSLRRMRRTDWIVFLNRNAAIVRLRFCSCCCPCWMRRFLASNGLWMRGDMRLPEAVIIPMNGNWMPRTERDKLHRVCGWQKLVEISVAHSIFCCSCHNHVVSPSNRCRIMFFFCFLLFRWTSLQRVRAKCNHRFRRHSYIDRNVYYSGSHVKISIERVGHKIGLEFEFFQLRRKRFHFMHLYSISTLATTQNSRQIRSHIELCGARVAGSMALNHTHTHTHTHYTLFMRRGQSCGKQNICRTRNSKQFW